MGLPFREIWDKRLPIPDPFLEDFEIWDSEAGYLPRWLEVLPELKIRVDQAIDRYERIRATAATGG
jgi:hypothetical protein